MKRSTFFAVIAVCSMGAVATTVSAAELTNPTPATTADDAKMPSTADFSNGPAGGGAALGTKDHIPSGGEFSNGPIGGAANDPTPRRMPGGAEFSNGPSGISKE
jgi:hypothetical protein